MRKGVVGLPLFRALIGRRKRTRFLKPIKTGRRLNLGESVPLLRKPQVAGRGGGLSNQKRAV